MYKTIVFDLDGTLLDTLDDLYAAVNAALGKYGLPLRTREEVRTFVGNGAVNLMRRASDGKWEIDELMQVFNSYYKAHCADKTKPYDGILELLQYLKAQGVQRTKQTFTFDEILNSPDYEYVALLGGEKVKSNGSKTLEGVTTNLYAEKTAEELDAYMNSANSLKLKISGIVRLKDGVTNGAISGDMGYTSELTKLLISRNAALPIVSDYEKEAQNAQTRANGGDTNGYYVNLYTGEPINQDAYEALKDSGVVSLSAVKEDEPNSISIYAKSFEDKDKIVEFIKEYNDSVEEAKQINYNDFIGMMMSSITTIVNAITYILIAFVSISLVVSSIMIGIITYISVLERTKEIGVLRSIGASKRDIKRVFNAETMIIGFAAGMLGIIVTLILNIPINIIINALSGIAGVASLPLVGGIALVVISVILTTIAGLLPASMASKKDPVVALRTE